MQWYWWLLIIAALAGFVFLKVKVGGAWMKRQQAKKAEHEKRMEDED